MSSPVVVRACWSLPALIAISLLSVGSLAFSLVAAPTPAHAQADQQRVLIYSGTTGYRHGGTQAINQGAIDAIQSALADAGYESDSVTCNGTGTGGGDPSNVSSPPGCRNADVGNPATFTSENLAQYDAIYLHSASDYWSGTGGTPGQLWNADEREAIIDFVQNGGGIAASHNATDMGAGQTTWEWWDGNDPDSVVGTTMTSHSAGSPTGNAATVQVSDRNHLSTRDLDAPDDTYDVADEHYSWARNVRGDHHVLMNFDERSYNPGSNPMGQDHPISWCKVYDGNMVEDGTGNPKAYEDGRTWITGIGHYAVRYTENGGDNNLVNHVVGGVRWVAGEGEQSDCGGTVWSNFERTVLVDNVNGPIAVDVAEDGKVYWTEIGATQGYESEGYVKMHDPEGPPNNSTTVATIPTRADHGNSEDGVLGMSLAPGFDLQRPNSRQIYVYYSPRNPDWPTEGNEIEVGYNLISRFTVNRAGTAFEPARGGGPQQQANENHPYQEDQILRVPKAKISGSPSGFEGGPTDSGPGHVGGASLVFDSEGNLYLGVGDDVSPNAPGHNRYAPMDHRAPERWDARKTSANTADLRGKVLRIQPTERIRPNAEPGVGQTYEIPDGNMFEPGTPNTRPEIYAMGYRQPFTVHADPANPGTVVVGEYCHDNNQNQADRGPAGVCEWNLVDEPEFAGWPFCVGDNAPINTMWRWDYGTNASTGEQYDCSVDQLPADLSWAPEGGEGSEPTFQGLDQIPGPAAQATIWRKYPGVEGGQDPLDFGDLSAGGMQPITGPVYRSSDGSGQGAFPPYYDGSWLIANRGSQNGFWKEVQLRGSSNEMLRVNDWLPFNQFGEPTQSFVIPTRFGPDGALYMARWAFGCCRNQLTPESQTQLVKIEYSEQAGDCTEDDAPPTTSHEISGEPHPDEPDTYLGSATLSLSAEDVGCSGVDSVSYTVNDGEETTYDGPVTFDEEGTYTVSYTATDRFGNESEPQTATFTVVDDGGGPGLPTECDMFATGTTWTPADCDIAGGGEVTWHFDQPDAQFPHDVWLVPPGGDPDPNGDDIFEVTDGPVPAGGEPVSYTFDQPGSWEVICRLHAGYADGQWAGMVGTVDVGGT